MLLASDQVLRRLRGHVDAKRARRVVVDAALARAEKLRERLVVRVDDFLPRLCRCPTNSNRHGNSRTCATLDRGGWYAAQHDDLALTSRTDTPRPGAKSATNASSNPCPLCAGAPNDSGALASKPL